MESRLISRPIAVCETASGVVEYPSVSLTYIDSDGNSQLAGEYPGRSCQWWREWKRPRCVSTAKRRPDSVLRSDHWLIPTGSAWYSVHVYPKITMCLCGRAPTVGKSWRSRISSSRVQSSIQARFWTYESQGRVLSPGPYGRGSPYNPSNLLHERLRIVTRCMSKNWRISSIERGESRRLRVRWHPPTGTTVPTSSTRE